MKLTFKLKITFLGDQGVLLVYQMFDFVTWHRKCESLDLVCCFVAFWWVTWLKDILFGFLKFAPCLGVSTGFIVYFFFIWSFFCVISIECR